MSRSKAAKRKQRIGASQASRKTTVTLDQSPWDMGATGQANQRGLVVEDRGDLDADTGKVRNPNGVKGARRVDLLEFWHKRGTISTAGYNAASALRDAFEATMRGTPALPDNDRVQSSPKPDQAVTIQIDRISRYQSIARHIDAADRQIVQACVLDGEHPSRIYGQLRVKEGLRHLEDALDRMADSMAGYI